MRARPTHRSARPAGLRLPAVGTRRTARHAAPRSTRPAARAGVLLGLCLALSAVVLPALPVAAAPEGRSLGAEVEALSPYQGQRSCDPTAKPGVVAFRDLVLAAYPGTRDSGIVRACSAGGTSEHKEGRAWDWRVNTANPSDVAAVDDLMAWLLADDEHGNTAAMARRLGVMYVIWDSRVWKSYQAARGWQPYAGASPHTDHVHVSFSWAGASGRTSYWSGEVAPVMAPPAPPSPSPTASPSTSATAGTDAAQEGTVDEGASASPGPSATPGAAASTVVVPSVSASASPSATASPKPAATPSASASASAKPTATAKPSSTASAPASTASPARPAPTASPSASPAPSVSAERRALLERRRVLDRRLPALLRRHETRHH